MRNILYMLEPVDTKASSSVEHTSGGRNEVSSKDHKGKISKGNASDKIGVDDSQLQRAAENIEKGKTSIVPKKSASSASPREDSVSMEVSNDDASKLPHPKGDQDRTASPLTISLDATRVPSSSSAASRREASKLAPDWLRSPRAVQTLPAPPPAEASSEGGIKPPSNLIKKKKLSGDKLTLGLSAANPAAQLSEAMESLKELRPLEVGQIFRGKVLSLEPFGAYVSLPSLYGVGMVRTRQVSHFKKIAVPSDILKKGDQVYVKVVEIVEKGPGVAPKIGLSMKYVDQVNIYNPELYAMINVHENLLFYQFSGADLDPKGIAYQRDVGIKLSSGGANYSNNNSGHRPSDNSVSSNKTFQNAASNHTAPAAADQRNPKPSTTSAGPVTDAVELALKSTESFDLNKFLAAKFIIEEQIAANLARLENKSTPEGAIDGVGSTAAPPAPTIAKPSAQPEHPAGRGRAATLPAWMTAEKNEAVKRAETQSELVAKPSAAALAGGSDSVLAGGRGRAKTLPAWMTDKTIEVIAANSERESGNTVQQSSSSLPAGPEGDVAILAGTGGGRGKAKTLPAWMTQGGAGSTGSSSLFNQLKGLAEKMAVSSASGKPMNPFPSSSSSSSAPGGRPTQSPSGGSKRRRSRSRDRDRDGDRRERSGGRGDWTGRRRSRSRSPSPYARSSRSSR
jgi:predicted RNA-binding protein with RPS1 domain